jgi:hypothetical protein
MIDVEGVSKSFGETEAFVGVKLEGPGGPPTPCERSPKAAPSTPDLFWTVRWSIAILAVFAPGSPSLPGRYRKG